MATQPDEEDRVSWPPPGYRTGDNVLDAPVQATHLDAAGAKKVCVDIGYFQDKYLKDIVLMYCYLSPISIRLAETATPDMLC